jgi:hypothetical protein
MLYILLYYISNNPLQLQTETVVAVKVGIEDETQHLLRKLFYCRCNNVCTKQQQSLLKICSLKNKTIRLNTTKEYGIYRY